MSSVKTEQQGAVLNLIMNRPEKKNALTLDMYQALIDVLVQAADDSAVKVVVLGGHTSCFSAGNDILDFMAAAGQPDRAALPLKFLQTISVFPKPIVAAVSGDAVGIGTTMLLHCDLVYATENARFQLPFARLGLVPEGGSSVLLPQLMGHRLAFELLVAGGPFSGVRAAELGVINAVVDDPLLHAQQQANQLAQMAPTAVCQSKAMLKQHQQAQLQAVLVAEVEAFKARLNSAEAKEAFSAFLEKRPAVFQ